MPREWLDKLQEVAQQAKPRPAQPRQGARQAAGKRGDQRAALQDALRALEEAAPSGAQHDRKRLRPMPRPAPGGGLIGALVGSFFKWLMVVAVLQFAAMLVAAVIGEVTQEPFGYWFLFAVWYWLHVDVAPLLPYRDSAPYLAALATAAALTLLFLPRLNARRRQARPTLVALINLAAVILGVVANRDVMDLSSGALAFVPSAIQFWPAFIWAFALVVSFGGGWRRRRGGEPRDRPLPMQQGRPDAGAATLALRRSAVFRRDSAIERTVGSGDSWRRAR